MKETIFNVIKSAAVMFAVGATLALLEPVLGRALNIDVGFKGGTMGSHAMWLGSFFGLFGGLHAAAIPLFDAAFGKNKGEGEKVKEPVKAVEKAPQIKIEIQQSPAIEAGTKHQDMLASQANNGPQQSCCK